MNSSSQTWLNNDKMVQIHELYHCDPIIKCVRNTILHTLLSKGIHIEKNGKELADEFKQLLNETWIPFVEKILDHIFMFGFCPYLLVPASRKSNKKAKPMVPHVPPFGSYKVEVRMNKHFQQSYHFYPLNLQLSGENKEDSRVKFLVSPNFQPSHQGFIRSKCSTLLHSFYFSREMFDNASKIGFLRANPTLITQHRPERVTGDAVEMEMYADGDDYELKADSTYTKDKVAVSAFQRQVNLAATMNGRRPQDKNIRIDPLTGKPISIRHKQAWEENVFVLPEGQQLAPSISYQTRTDLMDIERSRQQLVCGVFGIPSSLILSQGTAGGRSSSGDHHHNMYIRNMEAIKLMLVTFTKTVYLQIYSDDQDVEIDFPFLQFHSIDDLVSLGQQGVISKKNFGRLFLRTLGIPEEELKLGPPLNHEYLTKEKDNVGGKKRKREAKDENPPDE